VPSFIEIPPLNKEIIASDEIGVDGQRTDNMDSISENNVFTGTALAGKTFPPTAYHQRWLPLIMLKCHITAEIVG